MADCDVYAAPLLSLSHDVLCALMERYTAPFEWLLLGCVCRRLHVMLTSLRPRAVQTVRPYAYVIAYYGDTALLEWLRVEQRVPLFRTATDLCICAALYNRRDALRWLRQHRVCWDEDVCVAAAEGGNLPLLQWLREPEQNAPWDRITCKCAAANAHQHVLEWLVAHPDYQQHWCALDVEDAVIQSGSVELLQWFIETLAPRGDQQSTSQRYFPCAAFYGHVHIIQWLLTRGYDYDCHCVHLCMCNYGETRICADAAAGGRVAVLQFAREQQRWRWDEQVVTIAAMNGHHTALQYACENGAPVDLAWTCQEAAKAGRLHALRYVCERYAYVPDAEACALAAKGNHKAVLRYLHERHAPWDERVCEWALQERSKHTLCYALIHGAPCNASVRRQCAALMRRTHRRMKK